MNIAFPAIGILVLVAFIVTLWMFHFSRARSILEHWAEENGYEILSSEHRWKGGAFWWRKSKGQEVYYVTVRTPDGQIRQGWVRCGGWFGGVFFSDHADVKWDE
jgi:hypothetical protein